MELMPALTLHLDINGTCTPIDNTDVGLSPEQCVDMYLSKSCLGMAVTKQSADGTQQAPPIWVAAPWPHIVNRTWAIERNADPTREADIVSHYDFLKATKQPKELAYTFCRDHVRRGTLSCALASACFVSPFHPASYAARLLEQP
jgi:hypothetical protein